MLTFFQIQDIWQTNYLPPFMGCQPNTHLSICNETQATDIQSYGQKDEDFFQLELIHVISLIWLCNSCIASALLQHILDKAKKAGDIEEAIRAANAVGDDRLQSQSRGYVVPDSFTHGTSEQRVRWFKKGYETGDIRQGDTFNTPNL